MLVFNKLFFVPALILSGLLSCSGAGSGSLSQGADVVYNIVWEEDAFNQRWGEYLYSHLQKRCPEKGVVVSNSKNTANVKNISVEHIIGRNADYGIVSRSNEILLKASTEETMLWLIYQFIEKLSRQDKRIDASDLPPAIISLDTHSGKFDFEYREPFFRANMDPDYGPVMGTHSVDRDWAVWGHNLHKMLGENPSDEVYARQSNARIRDQYCFSSEELYNRIEQYIRNQYGEDTGVSKWFMIMPNDNSHVCLCENCQTIGNTSRTATPALAGLIRKLARQFSEHHFFTTAYLSTLLPNSTSWPSNTGVMISTIDLPKGIDPSHTPEAGKFVQLVNRWKQITPRVYVWDYAANFDDYLTPVPVLYGLARQLDFYKYHGIKGVFLNASGYDYSPFDDMKTYVSAVLLQKHTLPVDSVCNSFYKQFYPVSGTLLAQYYLSLEKRLQEKKKSYPLYGGFTHAVATYLDRNEFVTFYDSLGEIIPCCEEEERELLSHLYIALTYPRLQFAWLENDEVTARQLLPRMNEYRQYKDLTGYKEEGGELKTYIKSWEYNLAHTGERNLLKGCSLTALSRLDEDYEDLSVLTDGRIGFPDNYHQGWLLCNGDDLHVQYTGAGISKKGILTMRFLSNSRHRIHPPEKVEIYKNQQIYKVFIPRKLEETDKIWGITEKVDFSDSQQIAFKLYRSDGSGTIACDEIIFN